MCLLAGSAVQSYRILFTARDENKPQLALVEEEHDLATVRKYLNLGVGSAKDLLMDPTPARLQLYHAELAQEMKQLQPALDRLPKISQDPDLAREVVLEAKGLFETLGHLNVWKDGGRQNGYEFVHGVVYAHRNALNDALKDSSDALAATLTADSLSRASIHEARLNRLFTMVGCSLLLSVFLGAAALEHRRVLRQEGAAKVDEAIRARDDLEKLSGNLLKIQEEERRRLSRDLHDGLGQALTALRMEINYFRLSLPADDQNRDRLLRASGLAEEAVQTVRDISLLLRPPVLDDLGLEPALRWTAEQFSRRTGIDCRVMSKGLRERLPDDLKTCVFRVFQEALNNCEKHGSPSSVMVTIEQEGDELCLQVEDDGSGFQITAMGQPVRRTGLGILGMRERAVMLGGTLHIESSPGKGTTVNLRVPLASVFMNEALPSPPEPIPGALMRLS